MTNHKSTKNGAITGGFDRVSLFQQAERGFDKLFGYNRQQSETFDYHNTMKNNSISEQLKQQEANIQSYERKMEVNQNSNQENMLSNNPESKKANSKVLIQMRILPPNKKAIHLSIKIIIKHLMWLFP